MKREMKGSVSQKAEIEQSGTLLILRICTVVITMHEREEVGWIGGGKAREGGRAHTHDFASFQGES